MIGIDPHKASLTAVTVDCNGESVGRRRFAVNSGTATQLRKWSHRWDERRFAVEGAKGLGRGIAQILLADAEHVVDVPSTLAMRVRVLDTGGGRKTDADDARAVALTALRHKGLHAVRYEDQSTILRLLSERRTPRRPRPGTNPRPEPSTPAPARAHCRWCSDRAQCCTSSCRSATSQTAHGNRYMPAGPGERAYSRSAPDGFQHHGQRSADA